MINKWYLATLSNFISAFFPYYPEILHYGYIMCDCIQNNLRGIQFYIIKTLNNNNTKREKMMSYHLIINLKAFL